jgi:hypothetical protein
VRMYLGGGVCLSLSLAHYFPLTLHTSLPSPSFPHSHRSTTITACVLSIRSSSPQGTYASSSATILPGQSRRSPCALSEM